MKARHGKLKIVSKGLRKFDEVKEVHEVYGSYDIIAKIVVEDEMALKSFMQNKLLILEGVKDTQSMIALPDDEEVFDIDEDDEDDIEE